MEWRTPPAPGPSQIPESAPERDGFSESSSGGIVVVSSKHGTVPFSFSSSIYGSKVDMESVNLSTELWPFFIIVQYFKQRAR